MNLSRATIKKIQWQRIEDSAIGLTARGEVSKPPSQTDVAPIFATARQEFQRALASLDLMVKALVVVAGVSVAVCIAGVIVAATAGQLWGGVAFTGVGSASLFTVFNRIHAIGKDQALLTLIPTKYELALQFAATPADRRKVLDQFLNEVSSLKGKRLE